MQDKILKIAYKAMKSIRKAYKQDRDHLVRLDKDFRAGTFAETFTYRGQELPILDFKCKHFEIADRVLTLLATEDPICDGATLAPDKVDGVDLASGYLPHDYLYTYLEEMAADPAWKEAGWTTDSLRALFDAVLAKMIEHEEQAKKKTPWIGRVYYAAVRAVGGLAHRIGISCIVAATALAGCSGCAIPNAITPSGDEPSYTVVLRNGGETSSTEAAATDDGTSGMDAATSAVVIEWKYGAFDGAKAQEDPSCKLADLDVGRSSLSYRYASNPKIPSGWARRESEKGRLVVAAAFHWDELHKRWVGGKFDWTDESRQTRGLESILSGYGGWVGADFVQAPRHAFCIVSADGKHRSNLVED